VAFTKIANLSDAQQLNIIRLYERGKHLAEIAALYGFNSRQTIGNFLLSRGVTLRKPGWTSPPNKGQKMAYSEERLEKLRQNIKIAHDRKRLPEGSLLSDGRGYVWVKAKEHPNANGAGYVHEHRLVAESALGRPLKKGEVVHHINGDKKDNANTNLLICTNSYHRWLHNQMGHLFQRAYFAGGVL